MMSKQEFDAGAAAQFDVLPILGKDRLYSFGKYTYVIVGFALATWCFMIGGSLAGFVGFKTAIIASIAGNMIAVLIMITATVIPAARYGIDNYTAAGSFLGHNGTKALMVLLAIFQASWVIVFSFMVAKSILAILSGTAGTDIDSRLVLTVLGLCAAGAVWLIVIKGPGLFDKLNMIFAPIIVVLMVIMIVLIGKNYGFSTLIHAAPILPLENEWLNFLIAFELSLGAGFSWWPNMGGLARLCKTERSAFWPNIIGLVFGATLGTAVGVAAALLIGTTDPTGWMIPMGGVFIGTLALIAVGMANLTAVAIVAYNICLGFKQWNCFAKLSWTKITGLFMCIVFVGMFFAIELYNNFYIILGLACTVYSPIIAMQLVDFYVFRRQELRIRDLYNRTDTGSYYFWKGFNWAAVFVFLSGAVVYYLIMDPINLTCSSVFPYITATGGATVYALIAYYVLGKLILFKKGKGGYGGTQYAGHYIHNRNGKTEKDHNGDLTAL